MLCISKVDCSVLIYKLGSKASELKVDDRFIWDAQSHAQRLILNYACLDKEITRQPHTHPASSLATLLKQCSNDVSLRGNVSMLKLDPGIVMLQTSIAQIPSVPTI